MGGERIGEILVEKGVISPSQRDAALRKQTSAKRHRKLGGILLEMDCLSENQLFSSVPASMLYPRLSGARVLLVEDTHAMRRVVGKVLGVIGARFTEAGNGIEALARLSEAALADDPYRLVSLDLMMPKMDGIEALLRMHFGDHLVDAAVIVVSARQEKQVVLDCLRHGACGYVVKPFSIYDLFERYEDSLAKLDERVAASTECGDAAECRACPVPAMLRELAELPDNPGKDASIRVVAEHIRNCRARHSRSAHPSPA